MRNLEHKYLDSEEKISEIDTKKRVISGYLSQLDVEDKCLLVAFLFNIIMLLSCILNF